MKKTDASSRRTLPNPLVAAAVSAALGSPLVQAADALPALQEVVVTANRRAENALDIPYNISAVSAADLKNAGVTDLNGITRMVPGVVAADLGARAGSTNSTFIIRGLNASDQGFSFFGPNLAVPLVSTYLDEVPLFINFHLSDVARIEVLRGPQGTLYGSGAVGGTIRVIHNRPDPEHLSAELSTDVSGTQHSMGASWGLEGVLNLPVGGTAALRVAAGYTYQTGFIDALHAARFDRTGQPVLANPAAPLTSDYAWQHRNGIDSSKTLYAHAAFLWKPLDRLELLLDYTRQQDHSGGFSAQTLGYDYQTTKPIPNELLYRTVDVGSATASVDLGFATLTSVSSYYDNRYHDVVDESDTAAYFQAYPNANFPYSVYYYGGYPRSVAFNYDYSSDHSFVEELRLVSRPGGRWDYVLGGFYRQQKQNLSDPETLPGFTAWAATPGSAALYNSLSGTSYGTFDQVIAANHATIPGTLVPVDQFYNNIRHVSFRDRALYGELTRHLTDRWQVTGGLRQFWQAYDQSETQQYSLYGAASSDSGTSPLGDTTAEQAKSYRNHIWKLNTSFEVSGALRPYATFSEGFRHGGANSFKICRFTGQAGCEPATSAALIPYASDTARNYEVGMKGLVGGRLRYTVAVYRVDWQNIQLDTYAPLTGIQIVANGKAARSQGIELELTAQLTEALAASLGASYTDARLTSDFIRASFVGRHDDVLPLVPKTQLTAALDYLVPLPAERQLEFHLDAAYRSAVSTAINPLQASTDPATGAVTTYTDIFGTNYRQLGGFTTIDLGIAFQASAGLRARIYCNNLTNQKGVTTWVDAHNPANAWEYLMRPRTAGLNIAYSWR